MQVKYQSERTNTIHTVVQTVVLLRIELADIPLTSMLISPQLTSTSIVKAAHHCDNTDIAKMQSRVHSCRQPCSYRYCHNTATTRCSTNQYNSSKIQVKFNIHNSVNRHSLLVAPRRQIELVYLNECWKLSSTLHQYWNTIHVLVLVSQTQYRSTLQVDKNKLSQTYHDSQSCITHQ